MASSAVSARAVQLIDITYHESKNWFELKLREEGLNLLRSPAFQQQPLIVAPVIGAARSGKSTVMNNLLKMFGKQSDETTRFRASAMIEACTVGIWMWSEPIPGESGCSLVILDVEGNQTVNRNARVSRDIYCLAYLISNVLVWNTRDAINPSLLEELASLRKATWMIYSEAFSRSLGGPERIGGSHPEAGLQEQNEFGWANPSTWPNKGKNEVEDIGNSSEEESGSSNIPSRSNLPNPMKYLAELNLKKEHEPTFGKAKNHLKELSQTVGTRLVLLLQGNLNLENVVDTVNKRGVVNWGDVNKRMMRETNLDLHNQLKKRFQEEAMTLLRKHEKSIKNLADIDEARNVLRALKAKTMKEFYEQAFREAKAFEILEVNLLNVTTDIEEAHEGRLQLFLALKQDEAIMVTLAEDVANWSHEITHDSVMQSLDSLRSEFQKEVALPAMEALKNALDQNVHPDTPKRLEKWLENNLKEELQEAINRQVATNTMLEGKIQQSLYYLRSNIRKHEKVVIRARGGGSKLQLADSKSSKDDLMIFIFLDEEGSILLKPPSSDQECALYLAAKRKICITKVQEPKHYWDWNAASRFWLKDWNLGDKLSSAEHMFRAMPAKGDTPTLALYSSQVSAFAMCMVWFNRIMRGYHTLGTCRTASVIEAHYLFQLHKGSGEEVNECMQVLRTQLKANLKIKVVDG